jgi:uncharacterized membrane protein (UPF0127 family)
MSHSYGYCPKSAFRQLLPIALSVSLLLASSAVLARTFELRLGQDSYQIEVAETPRQRQLGLMHRKHLTPRQGMLLVYPQTGNHRIWMKNMLIPLQVYWIDEDFTVISLQRLQPCSTSPCPVYSAAGDTRYVLELGDYQHRLELGDKIEGLSGL